MTPGYATAPHSTRGFAAPQRNLVWDLEEAGVEAAVLFRDRDSKFTPSFDGML